MVVGNRDQTAKVYFNDGKFDEFGKFDFDVPNGPQILYAGFDAREKLGETFDDGPSPVGDGVKYERGAATEATFPPDVVKWVKYDGTGAPPGSEFSSPSNPTAPDETAELTKEEWDARYPDGTLMEDSYLQVGSDYYVLDLPSVEKPADSDSKGFATAVDDFNGDGYTDVVTAEELSLIHI